MIAFRVIYVGIPILSGITRYLQPILFLNFNNPGEKCGREGSTKAFTSPLNKKMAWQ